MTHADFHWPAIPTRDEVFAARGDVVKSPGDDSLASERPSADRPNAILLESEPLERHPNRIVRTTDVLTLLLASSQCSLRCTMCDLWRNTLDTPTPVGSLPRQIRLGLESFGRSGHLVPGETDDKFRTIKLYNSGNFFDVRSTPPADDAEIARLCDSFDRIVVENHPRIGTRRLFEFAKRLRGRLEVAIGLESIAPRMLRRLNKQLTPGEFFDHAKQLCDADIDVRVFLIHGLPWLTPSESTAWTIASARFAAAAGARHISLLPCRAGNGFMDRLQRDGVFQPPTREQMRDVMDQLQDDSRFNLGPVITMDTWGLEPGADSSQS